MGRLGVDICTDTATHTGPFAGFTVITDANIDTINASTWTNASNLTGVTLVAGLTIVGYIDDIKLASGKIALYKA